MNKRIYISIMLYVFFGIFYTTSAFSWDDDTTHRLLGEYAAEISRLGINNGDYLKKLGFPGGLDEELTSGSRKLFIRKWITEGEELEDAGRLWEILSNKARFNNHFHNPLKGWNEAGLDDWLVLHWTGMSSLLWAQNGDYQFTFREGDWSWQMTRDCYHWALTSTSNQERLKFFTRMFRGLGHQMHLIQDAAVPAHTRNNIHAENSIFGKGLEAWTKKEIRNINSLESFITNPAFPTVDLNIPISYNGNSLAPITQFIDTNQYNGTNPSNSLSQGLAEYSNANFFTKNTIFSNERYNIGEIPARHYFPYPNKGSTNIQDYIDGNMVPVTVDALDGSTETGIWLSKDSDGENIEYFIKASVFSQDALDDFGEDSGPFLASFYRDPIVHENYAKLLLPSATGYSAAMLNYFFRGDFDIYTAQIRKNIQGEITGIDIEVKNKSTIGNQSTIEPFENGHIALACQYTPAGQSQQPVYTLILDNTGSGVIYTITGAGDPINSDYVSISVSFAEESYIPDGATDVSFTIAFRGKLGHEENAVAAKTFPINTSRIAYSYRPDGWPEPSHIYTTLPNGTNKMQLTEVVTHTDPPKNEKYFFAPAWSPDGTKLAFENSYEVGCAGRGCAREIVIIDTTSESTYPYNVVQRLTFEDVKEDDEGNPYAFRALLHPSFSPDGTQIVAKVHATPTIFPLVIFDLDTGNWNYINHFEFWEQKQPSDPGDEENISTIAWSPQGDRIAYTVAEYHEETLTHAAFTDFDIYTISPDGTEDIKLTNEDFKNGDPSWSPDGEKIVFASDRQGQFDLYIMDKDGDNETMIFDCVDYNCTNPSFSPDGKWIVFGYGEAIHKFEINGPGFDILETVGSASPSWCPVMTVYDPSF